MSYNGDSPKPEPPTVTLHDGIFPLVACVVSSSGWCAVMQRHPDDPEACTVVLNGGTVIVLLMTVTAFVRQAGEGSKVSCMRIWCQ
jgi:hypothetical protein